MARERSDKINPKDGYAQVEATQKASKRKGVSKLTDREKLKQAKDKKIMLADRKRRVVSRYSSKIVSR